MKNIVFIGFMGSGKTTISTALAKKLGRDLFSTDSIIELEEAKVITEIFEKSGEAYFRKLEKDLVKNLSRKENVVIDCGGGVVLDSKNIENLKKNGVVFFLKASPKFIYEQVKGKKDRPLMNVEDPLKEIQKMLEDRASCYAVADYTINSEDPNIDGIVDKILKVYNDDRK
jgi:shikimate kinase